MMILHHDIPRAATSTGAETVPSDRCAAAATRVREMALGDALGAVEYAASVLADVPEDSASRIGLLAARAHALCYANRFEPALADLEEARRIAEAVGQAGELGPLWLTQVQPLARLGRLPEAAEAARKACEAFDAVGQTAMSAKARVNLGIVLRMTGRAPEALRCFDDAAAGLPDDPLPRGMLASNRAEALLDLDRFDEAYASFELALELLSRAGHVHAAAVVEGNVADLLSRRGEIDAALPRFDRAVSGLEKAGAHADAARLLAEEADALLAAGAHEKSIRLFERALPVLKKAGLTREVCRSLVGAGIARMLSGDRAGAESLFNQGVTTAAECGAGPLLAESRLALAELALAAGGDERARGLVRAALATTDHGPLFSVRAEATLAMIDLHARDARAALRRVEEALAHLAGSASSALGSRLWHVKASALAMLGDRVAARAAFRESIRLAERRRGAIRAERLRTAYLESSSSLYLDCFAFALDGSEPDALAEAFNAATLLKARTLNEMRPERGGPHVGADEAEYRVCVARLNALYTNLGPTPKHPCASDTNLRSELAELEARLDRLQDRREQLGDAFHDTSTQPVSKLDRFVDSMPPDLGVVMFAVDRDHVSAIVVTSSGAVARRKLATHADAAALERRLTFEVDRAQAGARALSSASLERVAEMFLDPVADIVGSRRVVLVGCPGVHALPLNAAAALRSIRGDGFRDVSMAPSPLLRAGVPMHGAASRPLIIGVPDDAAPSASAEAAAIAPLYPSSLLLRDGAASAERILDELPHADLVHFAGHGVFDADFPMSSRLRAADRWVTAREIRSRLRPGAVVVLSGCETGRMTPGEDRYGLARAFLAAGASALVGSLWRLHDEFARSFFTAFHADLARRGYGSPADIAACLGEAQRREAARSTPWSLWAGLFVKGVVE
ncbi:MAG: CHAT domain-containing protein [Phycisphaerales bacterium]